jgi:hypothetical protein
MKVDIYLVSNTYYIATSGNKKLPEGVASESKIWQAVELAHVPKHTVALARIDVTKLEAALREGKVGCYKPTYTLRFTETVKKGSIS